MPKRSDIKSILLIGAGPIVIGQACEFDYSGTQACKALKEEGYRLILVNSNPATIMTDPDLADATYVEPITPEIVAKIIEKERPDAILPTMGGQTALNLAVALAVCGVVVAGELRVDDSNGNNLRKVDYDPAPFFGATFTGYGLADDMQKGAEQMAKGFETGGGAGAAGMACTSAPAKCDVVSVTAR